MEKRVYLRLHLANLSAKGFKMEAFAALPSVQGYNKLCIPPQETPSDKDDGSIPKTFLIDVDAAGKCLALVIKLKANRWWGVKDIGEFHVTIEELLKLYGTSNDLVPAHYVIRKTQAERSKDVGVLDFSFKFENIVVLARGSSVAAPPTPGGCLCLHTPGYGGYPPPQMQQREETGMLRSIGRQLGGCLCGVARIAVADAVADAFE